MTTRVGVTKAARHLPQGIMTAAELSRLTGKPERDIVEDYGMREKRVSEPGESALDHALKAGAALLEGVDPESIDMVLYASSSLADYPLWAEVYKLHETLKLKHARMLELRFGCISSLHALEAAKNYMENDPRLNRALVIGAESFHFDMAFSNYANPNNEPTWIFADGGAAVLLETDRVASLSNALGPFTYRVDSSHFEEVPIPAGGVKRYTSAETVAENAHWLQLPPKDPKGLRRFGIRYVNNYLAVIEEAFGFAGWDGPPELILSNQLKHPLMRILLEKLGTGFERTIYTMPEWGHVGAADILLGLGLALEQGRLSPGTRAAIVSSGLGFSWGAAALEGL